VLLNGGPESAARVHAQEFTANDNALDASQRKDMNKRDRQLSGIAEKKTMGWWRMATQWSKMKTHSSKRTGGGYLWRNWKPRGSLQNASEK